MSDSVPASAAPLGDVREEGLRVARAAVERGLALRLMGGVAVWARCPSARLPGLERTYGDVDVVARSSDRPDVTDFLEGMGYVADKLFNALHGAQRLYFVDPTQNRPLDVILDRFSMCHAIDLQDRLHGEQLTIPLAELLLTKLQVVELNDKDVRDLIALFADHAVDGPDDDAIDGDRIADLLGADWGFEHTVRHNLVRLEASLGRYDITPSMRDMVTGGIAAVTSALDRGHKTTRWKARRLIGERVKWYEEPEEVRH